MQSNDKKTVTDRASYQNDNGSNSCSSVSHENAEDQSKSLGCSALSTRDVAESNMTHSKVRFGKEEVDLNTQMEAISQATFQELMDEERDKPLFAFARVYSKSDKQHYRRLYSAENIVNWYPLEGRTDPCTRGNIHKIEYFLHMKRQRTAVRVGDVYEKETEHTYRTADYFVWSITADDEPSKMMSLLATAYTQHLGLRKMTSNVEINTLDVLQLNTQCKRSEKQKNVDRLNASKIAQYVDTHLSRLVEDGELNCSDLSVLKMSIRYDAARHFAGILVSQDPDVDENSDDFSKIPHIRANALTMAILHECNF